MPSYTNKAINTNEMQKWRNAINPDSVSQLTNLVNQKADQSDLNTTNDNVNGLTLNLAAIPKQYYKLRDYLNSGSATKIKLIGDSETAGVGSTGYALSTNPIMTDSTGTVYYEGVTTSNAWANLFRNYITREYPSLSFVNAGIGGKSARWANSEKANWVSDTEDIVFVMLGTNDRWDSPTIDSFKTDLSSFLDYVDQRANTMIVMAAPPSQDYNTDGTLKSNYLRDMRSINKAIEEICLENEYTYISHFDMFFDYMTFTGSSFDYLLEDQTEGGTHPKDPGHELIWRNIQSKFHLKDIYTTWESLLGAKYYRLRDQSMLTPSTPATSSLFRKGKACELEVASNHPNIADFPDGASGGGGSFTTFKGYSNDLYTYQVYKTRSTNKTYIRYWDYTNSVWTVWVRDPDYMPVIEQFSFAIGTVPANGNISHTVTVSQTLNTNKVYSVTPTANPQGIIWMWSINAVNGYITFRFYNVTSADKDGGTFVFNFSEVIAQ